MFPKSFSSIPGSSPPPPSASPTSASLPPTSLPEPDPSVPAPARTRTAVLWALRLLVSAAFSAALPAHGVAQDRASLLAEVLEAMHPREIGPAVMGGRVADLAPLESNPEKFYVGLGSGGVWLTENAGSSWTPLFDDQPCSSIGDVTVFQANPNVVWVGTGEPQNRQSSQYGCGVFKSLDGGKTWLSLGLDATRHVARIVLHPSDPGIAYVAAVGELFDANPERGVYRTIDGGATWERVLYIDENTGAIDLVMDPADPRTLFAALYQRRRTAFGFSASGGGSGLYRTVDGGESWNELTNGLPDGDKGRIGVDVYRQDGNLLYALIESRGSGRGLYRTRDRGESWEKVSNRNPRPMYFSMVRIDPNNPERIYLGGVSFSASDDGGRTWWDGDAAEGIHVDHHALWIDPANSDHVILGNDGGVAISRDGARTWRHLNNLAIGQFYEIGVDSSDPYMVCGGLQDNSSWCAPNETRTGYGLRNGDWFDVWGGDGFFNQFDPSNPEIIYTESQGGNSGRVNLATGESMPMRPTPEDSDDPGAAYRWNWNSPIVVSRHAPPAGAPHVVYVASNHLHRSTNGGGSWVEASPDLTRSIDRDTLPIMGELVTNQTLSRHDGQSRYGTITTVSESPLTPEVLWVGTDDGNLQVSRDGGSQWTNVVAAVPRVPDGTYVTRVEASHHVEGRAYATFDGHWAGDYAPYVFVTDDFGESWRDISAGLPEWSVNVVREHPHAEHLVFAGSENGAFVSVEGGANWERIRGLPPVPVDDMTIHARDDDLVIGTHGRSIWIVDDLTPLRTLGELAPILADGEADDNGGARAALLFRPQDARLSFPMGGWPFAGEIFEGANPPEGAVVRYWLGADAEAATLTVLTAAGQRVRELEVPGEAGAHQVVWDLREDAPLEVPAGGGGGGGGFGFGGQVRGPLVVPGTYLVRLEAASEVVESELRVTMDARVSTTAANLRTRRIAARESALLSGTAALGTRAVRAALDQLASVRELLGGSDESAETEESAEAEDDAATGHPLVLAANQLAERLDSLGARLNRARPGRAASGIERHAGAPTPDQQRALDVSWAELPPVVVELNELLENDLPAFLARVYQSDAVPGEVESVQLPVRSARDRPNSPYPKE